MRVGAGCPPHEVLRNPGWAHGNDRPRVWPGLISWKLGCASSRGGAQRRRVGDPGATATRPTASVPAPPRAAARKRVPVVLRVCVSAGPRACVGWV